MNDKALAITCLQTQEINTTPSRAMRVWQDLYEGLKNWRIWVLLSWQDIRLRYRRSQLGPFWLTISMAITIYTMGFLYGHLLHIPIRTYFPYLATGMLTWNLISLLIVDGTNAFIEAENFLKQIKLPYSVFVLRVISRCFMVFMHNVVVLIPLYFIFHIHPSWAMLMLIPSLLLIFINAYSYCFILAMIGARFRDVAQLITSVMQIIFFVTPIMWSPDILPQQYQIWVELNPFASLVEILRAPLVSQMPSLYALAVTLLLTVTGVVMAFALLLRARHRIIYWL